MYVDTVRAACLRRGMDPDTVEHAISQYQLTGTLSAKERRFLEGLIEADMTGQAINWCRSRWGSEAAPVAYICVTENVGGCEPQPRAGHHV